MKPLARLTRGMTLGSRVVVINAEGAALLVKPSYSKNWILPGGGVERGESMEQAATRELLEEAGVEAIGPLVLHGVFSNHKNFAGDHLACYVLRNYQQLSWKPDHEIEATAFYQPYKLPQHVDTGSRRRIAEIIDQKPISQYWTDE